VLFRSLRDWFPLQSHLVSVVQIHSLVKIPSFISGKQPLKQPVEDAEDHENDPKNNRKSCGKSSLGLGLNLAK